ncbi:myosin light chain kinase 2, skeletal/cardiac muscle isoform X3 [Esox lucius]|uniref:myosin light chain kinase 2, skeletal/cardiac muscle isoform X3 n=1 Tax=Esox lucius TaxID=8010 RepID=UPI000575E5B8|nr:myosin light chain kinase 2, skeletal/cardiac muscle isoform X3 [Esox lucius]
MTSKIVNSNSTPGKPSTMNNLPDCTGAGLDLIQNHIEFLSSKMDRLINIQEKVLNRLDGMSQNIDGIERDVETLKVDKEEIHIPAKALTLPPALTETQGKVVVGEVKEMCQEMSSIMTALDQRSEKQAEKLDGMEKLVLSIQQVIRFIGENVKSSRVMELMLMGPSARKAKDSKKSDKLKDHKGKEGKEKSRLNPKGPKTQKKKPPDTADSLKKQALLQGKVQNLNRENAERSSSGQLQLTTEDLEAGSGGASEESGSTQALDFILEGPEAHIANEELLSDEQERGAAEDEFKVEKMTEEEAIKEKEEPFSNSKEVDHEEQLKITEDGGVLESEGEKEEDTLDSSEADDMSVKDLPPLPPSPEAPGETGFLLDSFEDHNKSGPSPSLEETENDQVKESNTTSKRRVTEEDLKVEDHKKSRVEGGEEEVEGKEEKEMPEDEDEKRGIIKVDRVDICVELKEKLGKETLCMVAEDTQSTGEQFFIDKSPPPPAPFNHRIVSAKPNQINNFYTINRTEVLGGGRFGQVHKCMENSSGLTLAAKIIKARSDKEKEIVKNEITVMNHLDHTNLIQLYAAYESRNDIILVLEYVDGGELFDRIIDENYTLMELDTVVFIRQICEGLQHMHKMYILHLDLKPENILCVSRITNKVKIIDFGLARIYKPREKLRVNFGTPEFLAPEVVNYDFVSFNTDMWSLGVITYMLLSGLCPFLGDDDNETMNNILACRWNFEEAEFTDISEEARDFISKLLVVNKNWRMGASEALRHSWLSDPVLHHRLHEKKNMCNRSRRSSCAPITDS